ncbi:alpha/beta hydrolase [Aequorivita marisscotiae]|uniref:Alpha/beta hydrolase-fold protein n=1 Tax=Aequorivita marisscotiae TaxID=3040348 RepID=A0ABY8KY98_9FLAO|nr:alpha/beta hydrolase-fold protein [Aequorivita sp. Ant34-E75]WGF94097.1 alpha/beta hydrolase-fold protein [Aequorivita sp. Ant34-E75]
MKIKIISSMAIFMIAIFTVAAQEIVDKKPLSIGETVSFHSKVLNEKRILNIYLPNSYSVDASKKYPVIYLLDGSIDEDFLHIAGLVQFGSFSWINLVPETIVVGIANIDRKKDYTYPSTDKEYVKKYPTTGHSALFIKFIDEEVQPLIEKTYNVSSEKTLIGQSLGGLLATEILFKKPDMFDNYIIVSPSLWYDYESLLKTTPEPYKTNKSIFVAVGEEGDWMKRVATELYEKLMKTKKKNTELHYKFLKEQDHGDALHLAVYSAFEEMFAEKN